MGNVAYVNHSTDFSHNYLWQYDHAPNLSGLMDGHKEFVKTNVEGYFNFWHDNVFQIAVTTEEVEPEDSTDEGSKKTFGLDLWGLNLGLSRDSFYKAADGTKIPIRLKNRYYRQALLGRIFLMNSNGSTSSYNRYLAILFNGKPCYLQNGYDMTARVIMYFTPNEQELALLYTDELFPLPSGVYMDGRLVINPETTFGFDGSKLVGFKTGYDTTEIYDPDDNTTTFEYELWTDEDGKQHYRVGGTLIY